MKTLFGTNKHVVLVVGIVLGIGIVAYGQKKMDKSSGKVEIKQDLIVLRSAVSLSQADEQAMDKVLGKYNAMLYKIGTVENGEVKKTQGQLSDALMTGASKAKALAAEPPKGRTHLIHQVICPSPCDYHQKRSAETAADKKRLIEELKPILEKYQ